MNISRKYDLYTAVIIILFAVALIMSYRTIRVISHETSMLYDISYEFDYLTRLKQALADLRHSTEIYINVDNGGDYGNAVMKHLAMYESTLRSSVDVKLDQEEKDLVAFATERLPDFSALILQLVRKEGAITGLDKERYYSLRREYFEKVLDLVDKHWKEDLEKVTRTSGKSETARRQAMRLLVVLSVLMLFIVVAARVLVSVFIIRPLKTIETISNDIAAGNISRRVSLATEDEFGSLSASINAMAEAVTEKIDMLERKVASERVFVQEQEALGRLMGYIISGSDIETVLRVFIESARELVSAGDGCIFIMEHGDNSEPELRFFINTYEENTGLDCARTMLKGAFFNAMKTLTPMRINTPLGETPLRHVDIRNLLAVPLVSPDKKVLGLIVVINKGSDISEDDADRLGSFSSQVFRAITMQQEIMRFATLDGLTGLYNQRVFRERLRQEVERAARYERILSLLMIDIDRFKEFNDTHGHQAGDYVLKTIGGIIRKSIRNADIGARYGGEEFAVILPEVSGPQAHVAAERLRKKIGRQKLQIQGAGDVSVTVSIGCATYPDDADTESRLIKRADEGLYAAKDGGRDRVTAYNEIYDHTSGMYDKKRDNIAFYKSLQSMREIARAVDSKSDYTRGHSFEIAALSKKIGLRLGLAPAGLASLEIAGLLHDIGVLSVPDSIINKPDPLTEEECRIVRAHTGLSQILLEHHPGAESILPAVLYHHERYDGGGYPKGLEGEEIPLSARIIGLAEAYSAMTSERPYKKKITAEEAVIEIEKEAGRQFDPVVVRAFLEVLKRGDEDDAS